MSFVVSARKYRPQNFDELIGQDHIATTLKNAIKNDKLAHAFLFSGPRGVGKTTSARILAKVLNCQDLSPEYHACNECSACKAFSDNASFNIFELDAASNNSVEHIRSLNDQVRFQPQQGSYKIYIIDEVHMLSQAAFNAFLKTLEEPPPYAKFILATTEKHKIIPTILSRCQIFDFRRIQIKDIVTQIKTIADKEQREFDDESLHLIAQKADGAMRDALSIYDKIVSTIEGSISYKDVANNLNVLDHDYYFEIVDAAIKEDFPALMVKFDEIIRQGFEVEQFTVSLLAHLRQLLLIKDLKTAQLMEASESLMKRFENQAILASASFIMTALSIVERADMNLIRSQNKRLTMEIALSKVAYMNRVVEKKNLVESGKAKAPNLTASKSNNSPPRPPVAANYKTDDSKEISKPEVAPKLEEKTEDTPTQVTSVQEIVTPQTTDKGKQVDKKEAEENVVQKKSNEELAKANSTKDKSADEKSKDGEPKSPRSLMGPVKRKKEYVSKIPTISSDIDALVASITKEETTKRSKVNPFSEEYIYSVFLEWKDKSRFNSFKAAIDHTKIVLEGNTVVVKTPSEIFRELLKQDQKMVEDVRARYPMKDLVFSFQIDIGAFPDYRTPEKTKVLTTLEKIQQLDKENPEFKAFVKKFKLKPLG